MKKNKNAQEFNSNVFIITAVLVGYLLFFWGVGAQLAFSEENWLAWAQVVVDIGLIPILIYGFWYTTREFKESQKKSELVLYWEAPWHPIYDVNYKNNQGMRLDDLGKFPSLAIRNIGNSSALSFSFRLSINGGLVKPITEDYSNNWVFQNMRGKDYRYAIVEYKPFYSRMFLVPGEKIYIDSVFEIYDYRLNEPIEIEYLIFSNKETPDQGRLQLEFYE